MRTIVFYASGAGSNVNNIITYFNAAHPSQFAFHVLTNNASAGVIEVARNKQVPYTVIDSNNATEQLDILEKIQPQLIVLAGYLKKIDAAIIQCFPHKIINIHPALLPKYGGKGMYGTKVHQAVLHNKEQESGITIHYVNEAYDEGAILLQKKYTIAPHETVGSLQQAIHQLEHQYFPQVIEQLILAR